MKKINPSIRTLFLAVLALGMLGQSATLWAEDLFGAASNGDLLLTKKLLNQGANVNMKNNGNATPFRIGNRFLLKGEV